MSHSKTVANFERLTNVANLNQECARDLGGPAQMQVQDGALGVTGLDCP